MLPDSFAATVVRTRPLGIENHEKINVWASFTFLYGYGAPLCGPFAINSFEKNTWPAGDPTPNYSYLPT